MDWWDQGKFYLREVTRSYSRCKAADQRSKKTSLTRQMHQLKRSFDRGDRTAFGKLCEVQQELRGIALHEARGAQVRARCQWAEEGETSSSFFLNLETHHKAQQTMHSIRNPETGLVRHDPFEILGRVALVLFEPVYGTGLRSCCARRNALSTPSSSEYDRESWLRRQSYP